MQHARNHEDVAETTITTTRECTVTEQIFPMVSNVHSPLLRNYVAIKISSTETYAMVDSGADISCAKPAALTKYRLNQQCKIYPAEVPYICTANNEKVPVQGVIYVKAEVANQKIRIKFHLVPGLHTDFILGVDWLQANDVAPKFGSGTLSIDPRHQLATTCETTVPPRSEKVVVSCLLGKFLPTGVVGSTSATPLVNNLGLASAGVLDQTRADGTVYQRLVNPSPVPVVIREGSVIGTFACVSGTDRLLSFGSCSNSADPVLDKEERAIPSHKLIATVTSGQPPVSSTPKGSSPMNEFIPSKELDFSESMLTSPQWAKLCQLVDEFTDVFMGPGDKVGKCDIIQHKIEVDPTQRPIKHRAYRLAPQQKEALESVLRDLEAQDVIGPSTSQYAAPCFLVSKKNGQKSRFVVDFRSLNKATVLDAHPLPTPAEALESLGATKPALFTTLDLAHGFYQLVIDPDSRKYTAFRCHLGLMEFRTLPMGLKNSLSTFQRVLEAVMRGLTWKIAIFYLDDIVVFSPSFERHLDDLRQVFGRLRQANLRLKPGKCHIVKKELSYLGHTVSVKGITVDKTKVQAVLTYPTPTDLKSLRSYLGLTGYFRRFIQNYAATAKPLYDLTRKGVPFVWSAACHTAFQQLKRDLTEAPVLAYPDFTKPFIVHTDASGFSVAGILLQEQPDKSIRPIAYAGRSLNAAETNYGITEKECLALIFAIKQFDCYMRYNHFTAVVDHAALQ